MPMGNQSCVSNKIEKRSKGHIEIIMSNLDALESFPFPSLFRFLLTYCWISITMEQLGDG